MDSTRNELIGTVWHSNKYGDFVITAYDGWYKVSIKFVGTGYSYVTDMDKVRKGAVKDITKPNARSKMPSSVMFGIGPYNSHDHVDAYRTWSQMLTRCYSSIFQRNRPTYKGCRVCAEWHNFQSFAKWFYAQKRQNGWVLDKDIILKGNKTYCSDYCAFVPAVVNTLFCKTQSKRNHLPIGVHVTHQKIKGYTYEYIVAQCNSGDNKHKYLGTFPTVEQAFFAYKTYKESIIKQIAEKYKNQIDDKVYNAMLTYQVEATD